MMKKTTALLFLTFLVLATPVKAQKEIGVDIYGNQAATSIKIAVPFPALAAGTSSADIDQPFFRPLLRDLAFSEIFAIVPLPPGAAATSEVAGRSGAQALLGIKASITNGELVLDVRLSDTARNQVQMARRYRGTPGASTRIAHTLANDLVQFFNGKPGLFLTQIAFISTRDGSKEIYLMDYDGANQRRITFHKSLTIHPDWSADDEKLVYTSYARMTSDLYIISRRGGGRMRIETGVGLNISPTFSPDGRDIAFVGSVGGNPDIYTIRSDGSNLRRLTRGTSIESTPAWSPTGRQIAFTSSRNGTPQIYAMDAEGSNVRRISFEGDWNDDASFSPTGEMLAYTSRVRGGFQIRVMNLSTSQSTIIAGEGSNEQPSWSPDGKWIVFMSNRTGQWQVYRVRADGEGLTQLTTQGQNSSPGWSRKFE